MVTAMPVPGTPVRSGPTDLTPRSAFPSPNCGPRRAGALPGLIVLHYTAMATADGARRRLCNASAEVSAHYLIDEAGSVDALVPEELRAWHAGAGSWGSVTDVNSHSIGIELSNDGQSPFSSRQMLALVAVLADLRHRWSIPVERVIAHSDMAPTRKKDPGTRFDWHGLAHAGQAVWPQGNAVSAPDTDGFADAARAFGYAALPSDVLLAAFRLRFRPWAKGPLDAVDMGFILDLTARFPVDATAPDA